MCKCFCAQDNFHSAIAMYHLNVATWYTVDTPNKKSFCLLVFLCFSAFTQFSQPKKLVMPLKTKFEICKHTSMFSISGATWCRCNMPYIRAGHHQCTKDIFVVTKNVTSTFFMNADPPVLDVLSVPKGADLVHKLWTGHHNTCFNRIPTLHVRPAIVPYVDIVISEKKTWKKKELTQRTEIQCTLFKCSWWCAIHLFCTFCLCVYVCVCVCHHRHEKGF